jgi:hemerythrin-like domain-containing protein
VKSRGDLLEKIAEELRIHTRVEEEIFYPAFMAAGGRQHNKLKYEAREEHRAVHHADEEESSMFPMARKALSKSDLERLGAQMQERKRELLSNP